MLLSILFKFITPFVIGYLLFKVISNVIFGQKKLHGKNKTGYFKVKDVIDICPKCGEVLTNRHRCGE